MKHTIEARFDSDPLWLVSVTDDEGNNPFNVMVPIEGSTPESIDEAIKRAYVNYAVMEEQKAAASAKLADLKTLAEGIKTQITVKTVTAEDVQAWKEGLAEKPVEKQVPVVDSEIV